MKLTIKITKEVLRESKNCGLVPIPSGKNCAIATAICIIFPRAYVYNTYVDFENQSKHMHLSHLTSDLPNEAVKFINIFDNLEPAERVSLPEFSFDIEVPEEVINSIGIEEAHRIIKDSKTLSLNPL